MKMYSSITNSSLICVRNFSYLEFFSQQFKGKVQAAGRKTCNIILQKWKTELGALLPEREDNSQFILIFRNI